uniref:Uncharacterized protein n=1 Tax=Micrurus corallinus TaxID=54390 RepID=A0A2D4G358_MICCO
MKCLLKICTLKFQFWLSVSKWSFNISITKTIELETAEQLALCLRLLKNSINNKDAIFDFLCNKAEAFPSHPSTEVSKLSNFKTCGHQLPEFLSQHTKFS